jgi:hypothetical protein
MPMNQRACFLAILLSTFSMATLAKAPIGGDDFDDNDRSVVNWPSPFTINHGLLTETNKRLEFTSLMGESSTQDFAAWAWGRYDPRAAQEWTFQIDVSLPDLALTANQSVLFGLEVNDQRNPSSVFSMGYNSLAGGTHVFTAVTPTGTISRQCSALDPCGSATAISDLTTIRFRFDGTTNTLFTEFDPNARDGDTSWTSLSTTLDFIPDTVYAFGQSSNRAVTSADNVYGDNVVTTAILVPEPSTYVMMGLGVGLLGWLTRAARSRASC